MAALMLPSAVLTHLNAGTRAAAGPEPVLTTWCLQPVSLTAPKQARPSLTTSQVGSRLRFANPETAWLQKLATRRSFRRTGLPSGVVSTAAKNGVLPGAPRPRLAPVRSPPRYASSISTGPLRRLVLHFAGGEAPPPEAGAQLHAGDALLALCQVIHGAEPQAQRQMGGGEDGARGQRGLMAAGAALEQPARRHLAIRPPAAGRALEAVRPA